MKIHRIEARKLIELKREKRRERMVQRRHPKPVR